MVELRKVVGSTNTVTALNLTLMYAFRVRHNLKESTVRREGNNQIHRRLLERRDEQLDEVEWSGIHEFVWRPVQTDGLGREERQKLCLGIIDNLVKKSNSISGEIKGKEV